MLAPVAHSRSQQGETPHPELAVARESNDASLRIYRPGEAAPNDHEAALLNRYELIRQGVSDENK
jgi:hypothetical protein